MANFVSSTAKIGTDCSFGNFVTVRDNVTIGRGVEARARCAAGAAGTYQYQ